MTPGKVLVREWQQEAKRTRLLQSVTGYVHTSVGVMCSKCRAYKRSKGEFVNVNLQAGVFWEGGKNRLNKMGVDLVERHLNLSLNNSNESNGDFFPPARNKIAPAQPVF